MAQCQQAEDIWQDRIFQAAGPNGENVSPELERSYAIFDDMSRITATKKLHELQRCVLTLQNPEPHLPKPETMQKSDALVFGWVGMESYGLALGDLHEHGQTLVRTRPTAVYGHMLFSTFELPSEITRDKEQTIDFYWITTKTIEQVRELIKEGQFPAHISETFKDLSTAYLQSLATIKQQFLDPEAPHFPAIQELYQAVTTQGTDLQKELFYYQLLELTPAEQGRQMYGALTDLTRAEGAPELYEECIAVIEDAFDDLLGEEAYELLGIEQTGLQANDTAYAEAQRQKKELLKLTKTSERALTIQDGRYGALELVEPTVYARKNGARTHVALSAQAKTLSGGLLPFSLSLGEKQTYSWNFLRNHAEVPELFDTVIGSANDALTHAIESATHTPTTAQPMVVPAKKLRLEPANGESSTKRKNGEQPLATPAEAPPTTVDTTIIPRKIVLPDAIATNLSEALLESAQKAIAKHQSGLAQPKHLTGISAIHGRPTYSIRHGKTRVLLQVEGDAFVVLGVKPRSIAYQVRG